LATRSVAEEVAVAFVYNGTTEAVMMATPADLTDFAVGFSLNEGLIAAPADLSDLTVIQTEQGVELRMWLAGVCSAAFHARRRRLAGPTGCGLCGIDSLEQAMRPPRRVEGHFRIAERDIHRALEALVAHQTLHNDTHAAHAAGYYEPGAGIISAREDVGRHNALDKIAGALSLQAATPSGGALIVTSRISVEMVQKASMVGAPVLIALSAPTALAIRSADAANITLVAVARRDSYQVFTHHWRIEETRRGSAPA
jgi:FdhD protein